VRITGQLVKRKRPITCGPIANGRELGDIFALHDEMTANIVCALVPSVERAEMRRACSRPPKSLDAYDLYLRAMAASHAWTEHGTDEALRLLEQALALDLNFVAAVLLAENCWARRHMQGWIPRRRPHRMRLDILGVPVR
jgi:hypothetical protein